MPHPHPPRLLVRGSPNPSKRLQDCPVLITDTPLSFWGGIDPITAVVVDHSHPWQGSVVTDTILCLPSGRGSCTASQVLLELIVRNKGPRAIVLRDADGLLCVGAMVAEQVLHRSTGIPDIFCVGNEGFAEILEQKETWRIDDRWLLESAASSTRSSSKDDDGANYSPTEEARLAAATTEAERMALQVIFRYARVLQYQQKQQDESDDTTCTIHDIPYVPITSAHIDGCTYIGPSGLALAQRLVKAGGTVRVPTTLNAGSTDRQRWQQLGVPATYAKNAIALGDAYIALGCQPSFTCAPYLLSHPPTLQSNVAWGESNAVVYCNSVLGARTEKYADYLDICCAIAGIVPAVGVHVHRQPTMLLDAQPMVQELLLLQHQNENDTATNSMDGDVVFPVLGHLCGTLSDSHIPLLIGLDEWKDTVTADQLKAFCAAFGTTAASPLIHIAGITPEASDADTVQAWREACTMTKAITLDQLRTTFQQLDQATAGERIDLVALGNPHLSATECHALAATVRQDYPPTTTARIQPKTRIIACMSRTVHDEQADPADLDTLRSFGMEFVFDTCWCMLLDPPVIPPAASTTTTTTILTHSGKYAHYGPGLVQRQFRLGSLRDCLHAARTGQYARRAPQQWWAAATMRTLRTWAR